jgi:hypothetical protein
MHLVDEPGREVLADRGDTSAEANVASIPSVTKWNVVPPSMAIGARGWLVSTNTGA